MGASSKPLEATRQSSTPSKRRTRRCHELINWLSDSTFRCIPIWDFRYKTFYMKLNGTTFAHHIRLVHWRSSWKTLSLSSINTTGTLYYLLEVWSCQTRVYEVDFRGRMIKSCWVVLVNSDQESWSQGGGGTWKRDQHSPFFFGALPDPPYIPNIVCFSHTYVFGDVLFWDNS
jgi:hypothetical protein